MATLSATEILLTRTHEARRRYRTWRLVDSVLATAAVLLAALVGAAALDNLAALSRSLLAFLAAAVVGLSVAVLLWRLVRFVLRRPSDDFLALRWERQADGTPKNLLINAIQLSRRGHPDSPQILEALLERAATVASRLDARQVVDRQSTRRWLRIAGAVAVIVVFYAAVFNQWFLNGVGRVLAFWSDTPHIRQVDIRITAADRIIEGQDVPLDIQVSSRYGFLPDRVVLHFKWGELDWQEVELPAGAEPGRFAYDGFQRVRTPIEYYVRAGRSTSMRRRVDVIYWPQVSAVSLTYHYPDYTGRPARTDASGTGAIDAVVGTNVDVTIRSTKALASARLKITGQPDVALRLTDGQAQEATGTVQVRDPAGSQEKAYYAVYLTDTDGVSNPDPVKYEIRARRDQAPTARFFKPGHDLVVAQGSGSIPLEIVTEDDFGVAKVELQIKLNSEPDFRTVKTWTIPEKNARVKSLRDDWNLGQVRDATGRHALREGDVVAYRARVTDHNDQTGPGVGLSVEYVLKVLAPKEAQKERTAQIQSDLQELNAILELQRQNKADLLANADKVVLIGRQKEIHQRTAGVFDRMRQSVQPSKVILQGLEELVVDGGPMKTAITLLEPYAKTPDQQALIGGVMDQIIEKLKKLITLLERRLEMRRKAEEKLSNMSQKDQADAITRLKEQMALLRQFVKDQDQIIKNTAALPRKPKDWTEEEVEKLEKVKAEEDKWGDRLVDGVDNMRKLALQDFSDSTLLEEYKEMIEKVEQAVEKLELKMVEMAVPLEQAGRELATKLLEDMEMWFPDIPDNLKWSMEEPIDSPEIPQAELPEYLQDLIGPLLESQDQLNDESEDITSGWADSASSAGWAVMDGPISSFGAQGKTGNTLPDSSEMNGRSGDGRSGRASGQLVENVAKGLEGRRTPTRLSNDDYEKGSVKELKKLAASGATGGGKKSGEGEPGLEGVFPPPMERDMERLKELQKGIREKTQRILKDLKAVLVDTGDLEKGIKLMQDVERDLANRNFRYADLARKQKEILTNLERAAGRSTKDMILRTQDPSKLPRQFRREILDAMDEAYPAEYKDALSRYFKALSESQ